MGLDLSSILGQVDQFSAQANKATADLFDLNALAAVSSSNDATTIKNIGANNVIIDSAKLNSDFAVQGARITAANNLGTNLKASGEVITDLSSNILTLMKAKDAQLGVIQEKQSVGLTDDPIAYLLNQITLPDDITKHNAINERLVANQTQLETLNKLTQSTVVTQNQLTESINQAGIAASAENTVNAATLLANKSARDALEYNAKGIAAALNVSKEVLASQFSALSATNAAQHLNIAMSELELSRQRFDWQKEEKKLADAAKSKATDTDTYIMNLVNDGLDRMGMAPIPTGSPRSGNILGLIKSGAATGGIYIEALKIAQDSELAGGSTILAPSPARAIELLNTVPGLKITPAQQAVKDLLTTATQQVAVAAQTPGSQINLKDPNARNAALNNAAKGLLEGYAKKIVYSDPANPFNVPPLSVLINASPPLQQLAVVEKVIAPAIAAGTDLSDPAKTFSLVSSAFASGKITYPEALELTSVFQRAVKVNLEARQMQSLGLTLDSKNPSDPTIFSYNVQVPTGTGFSGKVIVDFTKPDQLGRALNTISARANNPFNTQLPFMQDVYKK